MDAAAMNVSATSCRLFASRLLLFLPARLCAAGEYDWYENPFSGLVPRPPSLVTARGPEDDLALIQVSGMRFHSQLSVLSRLLFGMYSGGSFVGLVPHSQINAMICGTNDSADISPSARTPHSVSVTPFIRLSKTIPLVINSITMGISNRAIIDGVHWPLFPANAHSMIGQTHA